MTGFATFAYSKKYFVSQEIEFISESEIDPEFGESYKAPQDLIRLLADNVGIGTTNITTARQELDVYGTAIVSGRVGIATTQPREELDVIGTVIISDSVGIGTTNPTGKLQVGVTSSIFIVTGIGSVGIGSTQPEQRLDIAGSVKIDANIFDSANSPGVNGAFLNRDANGIRWVTFTPNFSEGIFIQDDGTYIPVVGAAQSFTVLNFKEINSLGIGTTTITPIPNPDNPTLIADIRTQDFWGYTAGGDIYRMTKVGIQTNDPSTTLDITGTLHATGAVDLDATLNVGGATTLGVTTATNLTSQQLKVSGISTLGVTSTTNLTSQQLNVSGITTSSILQVGIAGTVITTTGIGSVGIGTNLPSIELDINKEIFLRKALYDSNKSAAVGKTDYRLSSVGTGVSWRPSGVQTQNIIYVTKDGDDANSGLLEGDAKATVGGAAAVAQEGDTIIIRSGVYFENNPIGLRTDVSITGQDLRLVTIVPNNVTKDVFHVRRGCLIENLNFAGSTVSTAHTGAAAVAFPPTDPAKFAASGFIASGPATEGTSGRWRSPYVRNCTNFMKESIGMKIDGNHATASTIGADLKSMVCDSFTQYNEAGIGVSLTNNGYAQLVSIFTINCDIGIFAGSGGQCDLTNSNSSFGNFGLVAVGLGSTEFTGKVNTTTTTETDTIIFKEVEDGSGNIRRPYDGQALWFAIDLANYNTGQVGILTAPLQQLKSITVVNGGSGFSQVDPPDITIFDTNTLDTLPLGPEGIVAELSPNISDSGAITSVDVVNNGRNYLSSQPIGVRVNGISTNDLVAVMEPIFYTVGAATSTDTSHWYYNCYFKSISSISCV
jgi:aspartate 1-decarboxylase